MRRLSLNGVPGAVAAVLLAAGAVAAQPGAQRVLDMKEQELDTSAFSTWRTSALDVLEKPGSPEVVGKVVNRTGIAIDGLAIFVSNSGKGEGGVPEARSAEVTTPAGTERAAFRNVAGGWLATVPFPGKHGALPDDGAADLSLEIASAGEGPPSRFRVSISPTLRDRPRGSRRSADYHDRFELSREQPKLMRVSSRNWFDGGATRVKNAGAAGAMTSIAGLVRPPPELRVTAVHLVDPESRKPVRRARTELDGDEFTVRGFRLAPGDEYEVVIVYSEPPRAQLSYELEGRFVR